LRTSDDIVSNYQDGEQIGRAMVRAVVKIVRAASVLVSADIESGYGPSTADVAQTSRSVWAQESARCYALTRG
jgi:2-methylisocitrate lyase-like PEP mutase family enzyme